MTPIEYCEAKAAELRSALTQAGYDQEVGDPHNLPDSRTVSYKFRHQQLGVVIDLHQSLNRNSSADPIVDRNLIFYSIQVFAKLRTDRGGYAYHQLREHDHYYTRHNYLQKTAKLDELIGELLALAGTRLTMVVRAARPRPAPPDPHGFAPVSTRHRLVTNPASTSNRLFVRSGIISALEVVRMGILLPRGDGRWVFREAGSIGPDDSAWFELNCYSVGWDSFSIVCDGEQWHPLLLNHSRHKDALIATEIGHACHQARPVNLDGLSAVDQELIQLAISNYVTGNLI